MRSGDNQPYTSQKPPPSMHAACKVHHMPNRLMCSPGVQGLMCCKEWSVHMHTDCCCTNDVCLPTSKLCLLQCHHPFATCW
jgi:hypothetical protein